MLFEEIFTAYCENLTDHSYKLLGQSAQFRVGSCSNNGSERVMYYVIHAVNSSKLLLKLIMFKSCYQDIIPHFCNKA
jgi:hypothetical protein